MRLACTLFLLHFPWFLIFVLTVVISYNFIGRQVIFIGVNFRMKWLALFWLPIVAGCRMTKFVKEEGMALENHVIKTVTAFQPLACRWQCVDTPLCFSMNVRKLPTGWVTCELNNSSKSADPQDLISSTGSQYHQMAVSKMVLFSYSVYFNDLFV